MKNLFEARQSIQKEVGAHRRKQSKSVNKKRDDKYSTYRQIGILTTIPMLMAVGPILGYYIGDFLDQKLGTAPYLMVVFIFFGFAAAGKGVYDLIKKASQQH